MNIPQSPVDVFAHTFNSVGVKLGEKEAIHTALTDVDLNRLRTFNKVVENNLSQFSNSTPNDYFAHAVLGALRSTNGVDNKANIDFSRKIQTVFQAIDALPDLTPSGMDRNFAVGLARLEHDALPSASKAIDHYINSELLPQPQAKPDGQRRHFNKAKLTSVEEHIFAGTASRSEIMSVQQELKDNGFDLGKFGKKHDGIDGKAGKFTLSALQSLQTGAPVTAPAELKPTENKVDNPQPKARRLLPNTSPSMIRPPFIGM